MKRAFAAVVLLLVPACALAQSPSIFGHLDNEPFVDSEGYAITLTSVAPEALPPLPSPPAPGDRLFRQMLRWQNRPGTGTDILLILVEPADGGAPFLYADLDRDGKIAATERLALADLGPDRHDAALLRIPVPGGSVPYYPLLVSRVAEANGAKPGPNERFLRRSLYAFLDGEARVDGRSMKVRCAVRPSTGKLDTRVGPMGMDLDGDGRFDLDFPSLEWDDSGFPQQVFRVGERYLSIDAASDPAAGRLVLRSHPASDYIRFDLRPGRVVPDFAFTDADGKERRLSELRGKHVLLKFWATWCEACVKQLDGLDRVYDRFHDRGLEIVGMDEDEEVPELQSFLAKRKLPWIQATAKSIQEITRRSFIADVQTMILLDPEGRVVTVGTAAKPIPEGELMSLLERRLPGVGPAARLRSGSGG
jgi:peroxiredoxin